MVNTQALQQIRNELESVAKSIQQLNTSVGTIVAAFEKLNGEESRRPRAKHAPVRKKVVVKNGVVETIKRVPSTKIVYDVLRKSGQGMDIAALMKATGYDQRKV